MYTKRTFMFYKSWSTNYILIAPLVGELLGSSIIIGGWVIIMNKSFALSQSNVALKLRWKCTMFSSTKTAAVNIVCKVLAILFRPPHVKASWQSAHWWESVAHYERLTASESAPIWPCLHYRIGWIRRFHETPFILYKPMKWVYLTLIILLSVINKH